MKNLLRSRFSFIALSALTHACVVTNSFAEVKLSGYFIARSECPAFQSIRKQSNPGNVVTTADFAYDLIAKNKQEATHFLIAMEAMPNQRWVEIRCGEHVVPVDGSLPPIIIPPTSSLVKDYVLAVSWQPGFCETRPSKSECVSQTEDRFDASNFALHGLWPQPRSNSYCNVAAEIVAIDKGKKWDDLPALELEDSTRTALNQIMPGSQSNLHRHEWFKHGTCYNGEPAEDYFKDSLKLVTDLNSSAVRDLFANNIGNEVTSFQIRDAFDNAFGEGAGDKIKIACKNDGNRRLITEITIGLKGNLDTLSLGNAMSEASNVNNAGCNKGIVDPAGFQ